MFVTSHFLYVSGQLHFYFVFALSRCSKLQYAIRTDRRQMEEQACVDFDPYNAGDLEKQTGHEEAALHIYTYIYIFVILHVCLFVFKILSRNDNNNRIQRCSLRVFYNLLTVP